MTYLVLTGDIVESSDMSVDALNDVMKALSSAARQMSGWNHSDHDKTVSAFAQNPYFSRRGGDGWQILLSRPEFSLRAALFLQACLRSLHEDYATRIAAAIGEGELPQDARADLNAAYGPVFQASGRLLETLSGRTRMAYADGGALDAAFRLADHISQGWTQAQARALYAMLPPGSGPRRIVAEQLGISRQAVDQALWAAGYPAI
ncbi:MAG: MarR family transcriptional regulator [Maritimibacter sp.]